MSLQHIQKNSPRLLPKPAKFEKNPPNGYRVINDYYRRLMTTSSLHIILSQYEKVFTNRDNVLLLKKNISMRFIFLSTLTCVESIFIYYTYYKLNEQNILQHLIYLQHIQ